jgi:RimJ/RimL family protein N-acetyltransferase
LVLASGTAARVHEYWRAWASEPVPDDALGLVVIEGVRYVQAPAHLVARVVAAEPDGLDALLRAAGVEATRSGAARLAYADAPTVQLVDAGDVEPVGDDDPRSAALAARTDRQEWLEASADEVAPYRYGATAGDELLAVASLHNWSDIIGQVSVLTRADVRGRGLAARVASAAITQSFTDGLVPQWRSRIGNDASARVADKLGFVPLGTQAFARFR